MLDLPTENIPKVLLPEDNPLRRMNKHTRAAEISVNGTWFRPPTSFTFTIIGTLPVVVRVAVNAMSTSQKRMGNKAMKYPSTRSWT